MNKNIYSLFELMNELVVVEGILGTSSVDGKKKKKKGFTKQDGKQISLGVANKGKKKGVRQRKVFPLKVIGRGIVQYLELPRIRV